MSEIDRAALECHNQVAKESEYLFTKTEQEFVSGSCGKYISDFYQLARKPLLDIIKNLEATIKDYSQKIGTHKPQINDTIWTGTLNDNEDGFMNNVSLKQCKIIKTDSTGFWVYEYALKRLYNDVCKTWFPTNPSL